MSIAHPTWIEIDLTQFEQNMRTICSKVAPAKVCVVVKANAYGHGLLPIARAAVASGVDQLAVAYLQEAVRLREGGITHPILVLGAIHENQIPDLLRCDLEFTISSKYKGELVAKALRGIEKRCKVHVEIDVGMRRTGVRIERGLELIDALLEKGCFEVVGLYSHLPSSDLPNSEATQEAIERFTLLAKEAKKRDPSLICHIANSGAILHYPNSYLDMVRPGILSFGISPGGSLSGFNVSPCLSLKAHISYFKVVEQGEGISYGHLYKTKEQSRIVTIPIGYGDGYRRALANRAEVLIRGKRYPVVGAICMDQFMVNIGQDEAYVGEEVTLIGKQGIEEITIEEISSLCDTVPYEIFCSFNHDRLPRTYTTSPAIVTESLIYR